MKRKRIICLFLFIGLIFIFSSCHPRHVSDIKPAMTKEEVVSLWGRTDLITYKNTDGTTLETWEYHFAISGSICLITFAHDRVATTQYRRNPPGGWYYSLLERQPYPGPYYCPQPYTYSILPLSGGAMSFCFQKGGVGKSKSQSLPLKSI